VSLLFDFIEPSESPRLFDTTYPMKMRWYKILAQILLMLPVIDFALAAPVVVQEHEVRVSVVDAAKDGTAPLPPQRDLSYKRLANAQPIPRSSDSGHWREQRQYSLRLRTDSIGSLEPANPASPIGLHANNPPSLSPPPGPGSTSTSQAPTDKPDPLNPSSPHGNTYLTPSLYQGQGPTDNSDR